MHVSILHVCGWNEKEGAHNVRVDGIMGASGPIEEQGKKQALTAIRRGAYNGAIFMKPLSF